MQPLQSARGFRTFLNDTQSLSTRRSRLGLFTLEDRQAAGSLMDMLLAGAMASDRAQPLPTPADNPRVSVSSASPLSLVVEDNNTVALLGQAHDEATNDSSVSSNPLGTFVGEGGGQFVGFGDLDQPSNSAPATFADWRVAPAELPTPNGPVDESVSPPFSRSTPQAAPAPEATSMKSNEFPAIAAAFQTVENEANLVTPNFDPLLVTLYPTNGYSGGTYVILITKAAVCEVEYRGDAVIRIAADPGTPAYPMTGPQYRDVNANGVINPSEGDFQLPVAYPRGSTVVVTAKFYVEVTVMQDAPPGTDVVTVKGTSPNSGIVIPPTTASWDGGSYVTLPPTSSTNTLVNSVEYYPGFGMDWKLSHNQAGQSDFISAGASFNEMYVTLAKPSVSPVYHTYLH